MIHMMGYLGEPYSLHLVLPRINRWTESYFQELKHAARDYGNIRFLEPFEYRDIVWKTNTYDIGVCFLPPTNFNLKHCLPSKFFQFVQARLALAIGPSPEMSGIVRKFDLGVVAEDFSPQSMADAIRSMSTERIAHFKMQAHKHAQELSSEKNGARIKEIICGLLGE